MISGIRLGPGRISVAPDKRGLSGHGVGASAAILAASGSVTPKAVAAVFRR